MKIEVFRNKTTVRFDLGWYGVGRHDGVFHNNYALPGVTYFLNSYRRAPVHFHLLNRFGQLANAKTAHRLRRVFYTGSQRDPRASWHLRFGRFFIGGETPKWVVRWQENQELRRALAVARRDGDFDVICSHCHNGLICEEPGHPGEHLLICSNRRCGRIVGAYWNRHEVE